MTKLGPQSALITSLNEKQATDRIIKVVVMDKLCCIVIYMKVINTNPNLNSALESEANAHPNQNFLKVLI